MNVGLIAKQLADEWSKADETVKGKYENMAAKDRERYLRVGDAVQAGLSNPGFVKPLTRIRHEF